MELSLAELTMLIEAMGTQDAEYGLRSEGEASLARLQEVRDRRRAEIEAGR